MMKFNSWLAIVVAWLVVGLLVIGCGGGPPTATPNPPSPTPQPTATIPIVFAPPRITSRPGETSFQPAPPHPPDGDHPHIALAELTYDFGDVPPTAPVEHIFTFTNTGTTDLVIQRLRAS